MMAGGDTPKQMRCLMKQGLYEQILNNLTKRQLSNLDASLYDIGIEQLDPEEARKLLE